MHVPFRHPQKNSWKMPNWRFIAYRNIYTVANHVMYIFSFKNPKKLIPAYFTRTGWEQKHRTNLTESIIWMKVGFWMHVITGLISAQMISEKAYPALVFWALIPLLLLSLTTDIATTILSMAVYHQGLHRRLKQNPHQTMIPYFPYSKSYSPIDLPYGTLLNC